MKEENNSQRMGRLMLAVLLTFTAATQLFADQNKPPEGFEALFNGTSLDGWWGAKTEDPREYMALPPDQLAKKVDASVEDVKQHWRIENGELINDGHGLYLTTKKFYGDFELLIQYKTVPRADSGIYLRGIPQVQIWDYTDEEKFAIGADKGSGGLWNNPPEAAGKDPLVLADKPFGEWNAFRIVMVGEHVSVWLNDQLVVDQARMHNFFDRSKPEAERRPLPRSGPIQLQTHGGEIRWRDIFVREIGPDEANTILASRDTSGFESVFNGKDLTGWAGAVDDYTVEEGAILCRPDKGGTLFTEEQYADFVVKLEFQLPPGGNNGLAIRYPGTGHGTWGSFCELQVLDDGHPKYNDPEHPEFYQLKPQQAHASVYARVPAHRGYLRPTGQWNFQESTIIGTKVKVELNGFLIVDTDLSKIDPATFMYPVDRFEGRDVKKGHFGFNGHKDPVRFRKILIRKLEKPDRVPNIVYIMADDLGYGDLGCYGQETIQTPNLDRLAAEGMRFTNYYAGCTVCRPSRLSLWTGYHMGHTPICSNAAYRFERNEPTVAELLRNAGYATGGVGKWAMGQPDTEGVPNRHGFDFWFGYLDQSEAHNYYPTHLWRCTGETVEKVPLPGNVLMDDPKARGRVAKLENRVTYSHDLMTDEAFGFIRRNADRPFLLHIHWTIPHANNEGGRVVGDGMEVPDYGIYADRDWTNIEKGQAAMITRMDGDVGRLIALLKEKKIDQRTLVLFTSDNGPHSEGGHQHEFFDANGPLRGFKRDLYEGGIRVPLIAWWPEAIEAGTVSRHICAFWDFLPTACELGGAQPTDDTDGISFVPALLGREQKSHDNLYWKYQSKTAVRMGKWKSVRLKDDGPIELYDLETDIGETNDLAAQHPEVVARMQSIMADAYAPPSGYGL